MPINSFLYPAPSTPTFAYNVDNSLRFNAGDSMRLTRSFSAGSSTLWTWSGWIKRSKLGSRQIIFSAYNSSTYYTTMEFTADDYLKFNDENNNNTNGRIQSSAKYRDPSAWMHIVFHWDSSDSTSADRLRMYVNNERITSFSDTGNYPSTGSQVNTAITHEIGSMNNSNFFEGYMTEVVFINGANLDPDQFGEYNEDSPTIWQPKDISGLTFGTTGFYLDFEDSGDMGDDESGNGNDWTEVNIAATDQSTDTCTNNFATMNPLFAGDSNITYSEGNLKTTAANESQKNAVSTLAVSSGKWYCEMVSRNGTNYPGFGIMDIGSALQTSVSYLGSTADSYCMFQGGLDYNNGSENNIGTSWGENVIMGIAIDLDSSTKTIKYYKAGSEIHSRTISTPANGYVFAVTQDTNGTISEINFGSPPYSESGGNSDGNGYGNFSMSVPSGYYALNTKNLAEFG